MEMVEFVKMMIEHREIEKSHTEFYEMAEKYGFCTPWCHLSKECKTCKDREVSLVV